MKDDSQLIHLRFFAMAQRFGEHPALVFYGAATWKEWSYSRLSVRVSEISSWLKAQGVRSGEAIGIIAVRHPDTIAAMIAILDAGAHYVPLDPDYPEPRLRLLCENASVKRILSAVPVQRRFPVTVDGLEGIGPERFGLPRQSIVGSVISPEMPAYVMFTSGSTGEPKGVVVPHRAIIRLIDNPNYMRLDVSSAFLCLAPLGFDASTLEIWGPLLNGGKCVLYPERQLPTASGLRSVISAAGVNSMWLTASLFNSIVDQDVHSLSGLRELLTGGESLSVQHVCKVLAELPGTQLINGYGPTENTTFTACFRIPAGFSNTELRVPVGAPVSGTDVVVVDENLRPVPAGVEGELIALGEGLALGYLNKPGLTEERFIEVTMPGGGRERGYRTGDRVVMKQDGLIDFLGRFDDQLKIDGHRIEPGEIERVITNMPGIRDCRVLMTTGPAGQKRLVAYVVVGDPSYRQDLRSRLSGIVPAYMVPHYFHFLDRLPTNANGKLDKSALPNPFEQTAAPVSGSCSSDAAAVMSLWETVLGRRPASEEINFFDAGGTSLEAMRLHEQLSRHFSRELDPTFVFEHSTIRRQVEALTALPQVGAQSIGRGQQRRSAAANRGKGRRV